MLKLKKKDIDDGLYKKFLLGDQSSFELLYSKYKNKIKCFIYNIVKDIEQAEDITQEVFIYIMQNEIKDNYSFKYHIYLLAKSRAINYINVTNRRKELNEKINIEGGQVEQDILNQMIDFENRKEILKTIALLEDKYKNVIYLVYFENMSYKDTAEIIGESLSNTKNLIRRGKTKLYKILLKKGFDGMNKKLKIFIIALIIIVSLFGVVYATSVVYVQVRKISTRQQVTINPTFEGLLDKHTANNLWVGTMDIAWKRLTKVLNLDKIEFKNYFEIVEKLNESKFTEDMLSKENYDINVEENVLGGYTIETKLNKVLTFEPKFENLSDYYKELTFGNENENIKYFGIESTSFNNMYTNVRVLFYNSDSDFAVKLLTKEKDEILLYRTNDNKSFDEYYNDIIEKETKYTGSKDFQKEDKLRVPFISFKGLISYNDLLGKEILNSNGQYIKKMIEDVDFAMNESGCNLLSNVSLISASIGINNGRLFYYNDIFVLFMKEEKEDMPYFSLKVDNSNILDKKKEYTEITIIDYTTIKDSVKFQVFDGEYKFYEDDNYEYFYPKNKTMCLIVYYPNGTSDIVEYALKNNRITIDLLDKFNIDYYKKSKN